MILLLRKSSAQARIEGWDPRNRSDHDYAVVEDMIVGRIYREMILGKPKWRWFLQQIPEAGPGRPIPPPNQGMPIRWRTRRQRSKSVMRRSNGGSDDRRARSSAGGS